MKELYDSSTTQKWQQITVFRVGWNFDQAICFDDLLYYNYKTTKKFTPSDYKFIKVGV